MNKKLIIIAGIITLILAGCSYFSQPPATNPAQSGLTEAEARSIAEKNCIKGGESLSPGYYNESSKTWWFDANLNATKEGCNPACVVFENTKTTEINWRCTGLIPPDENTEDTGTEDNKMDTDTISDFEECVSAGNPVMESYPRQCRDGDRTFTENIGNELGKAELIRLDSPRPNEVITSPLTIKGEARGPWFFEASFPVVLTNWDGLIIADGIAQAQGAWMTEEFVPFEAELTFTIDENVYSNKGALILQKDNPSGLPENADAFEIPVLIGE